MKIVLCYLLPIVCVLGAIYLADQGKEGWGWLLFVAFATPRCDAPKPSKQESLND